jgi:hypothetical protein
MEPQGVVGRQGFVKHESITTPWHATVTVQESTYYQGNAWVRVSPANNHGWVKIHDFEFLDGNGWP